MSTRFPQFRHSAAGRIRAGRQPEGVGSTVRTNELHDRALPVVGDCRRALAALSSPQQGVCWHGLCVLRHCRRRASRRAARSGLIAELPTDRSAWSPIGAEVTSIQELRATFFAKKPEACRAPASHFRRRQRLRLSRAIHSAIAVPRLLCRDRRRPRAGGPHGSAPGGRSRTRSSGILRCGRRIRKW